MTSKIIHSDSDPLLTTKEAAQRLGVTLRTVQLWVNDGKLQAARTPGGHRRIRASDVRALQEATGIKPVKAGESQAAEFDRLRSALKEIVDMTCGEHCLHCGSEYIFKDIREAAMAALGANHA